MHYRVAQEWLIEISTDDSEMGGITKEGMLHALGSQCHRSGPGTLVQAAGAVPGHS